MTIGSEYLEKPLALGLKHYFFVNIWIFLVQYSVLPKIRCQKYHFRPPSPPLWRAWLLMVVAMPWFDILFLVSSPRGFWRSPGTTKKRPTRRTRETAVAGRKKKNNILKCLFLVENLNQEMVSLTSVSTHTFSLCFVTQFYFLVYTHIHTHTYLAGCVLRYILIGCCRFCYLIIHL